MVEWGMGNGEMVRWEREREWGDGRGRDGREGEGEMVDGG